MWEEIAAKAEFECFLKKHWTFNEYERSARIQKFSTNTFMEAELNAG